MAAYVDLLGPPPDAGRRLLARVREGSQACSRAGLGDELGVCQLFRQSRLPGGECHSTIATLVKRALLTYGHPRGAGAVQINPNSYHERGLPSRAFLSPGKVLPLSRGNGRHSLFMASLAVTRG